MIINPAVKNRCLTLKIYIENTFCIVIANKFNIFSLYCYYRYFIMAIFLFSGHQTLKVQKVNAQYNQDNINNNKNNNSINNNYKKINFTNAFNLTNNTKNCLSSSSCFWK